MLINIFYALLYKIKNKDSHKINFDLENYWPVTWIKIGLGKHNFLFIFRVRIILTCSFK